MPRRIRTVPRSIALIAVLTCVLLGVASYGQQTTKKSSAPPLKLEQVTDMVSSGLSSVDILVEAKARGLNFIMNTEVTQELEDRGADSLLLNWLGLYAVELQPQFSAARVEQQELRFGRVVEVCNELLGKSPRLPHIYLMRGAAFRAEQKLDQAVADFRQALQYHHNSSRARLLLAETLIERKETDAAIRELTWIVDHRSAASVLDWPTAHRLLAAAYLQRRDYSLASLELHTALWQAPLPNLDATALLPAMGNPMSELARLLALCPDPAIASPADAFELANLLKLTAINPAQQQTALLRLSEAQAALGRFDEAISTLKSAEVLNSPPDAAIAEHLKLFQKHQLPLLPPGVASQAANATRTVTAVSGATLLARMKNIELAGSDQSSVERPRKSFWISKYEVTQAEWADVMGHVAPLIADLPVERVSWDDCQIFLKKLNERVGNTGPHFRLPTIAELRYVSHLPAKNSTIERWNLHQEGWYAGHGGQSAHQVGSLSANAAGLFDVYGNVAEWCADDAPTRMSKASKPGAPTLKIAYGGSYLNSEKRCLAPTGSVIRQNEARRGLGLRLVAELTTGAAEPATLPATPPTVQSAATTNRSGINRAIDVARSALETEAFQRSWLQEKLFTLMYLQACVRSSTHDIDTAVANLRALIRDTTDEGTPLIQLARCHLAWIQSTRAAATPEQLAEARKIVETALTRSEFRLWIAYLSQSAVLVAEGKLEDAVRRVTQALDLAPAQFKPLCTAQLESIRSKQKVLSIEFPVPPSIPPMVVVPP